MRRDYIPDVGLKWESQNGCITAGIRSQEGGCSHSKIVHVSEDNDGRAAALLFCYLLQNIIQWKYQHVYMV